MYITDDDNEKHKNTGQAAGEKPAPESSQQAAGGLEQGGNTPTEANRPKVSERKRAANRANAQKSTGPRTPKGKRISRFNALRHGLLSRHAMLDGEGNPPDEGMQVLMQSLREKYGTGDVVSELLLEATIVDYYRNVKGLEYEKRLFAAKLTFWGQGEMPCLQRYVTANRNALLRDLQLLEQLRGTQARGEAASRADSMEESSQPVATEESSDAGAA